MQLIIGLIMLSVKEVTIEEKAPPIITPTARFSTFPLEINSLNSSKNFFNFISLVSNCFLNEAKHQCAGGTWPSGRAQTHADCVLGLDWRQPAVALRFLSSCVWDALTVLWSFQPVAVLLARQTTQLSLPESKEDNAATVLKTDVYPCTLM